MHPKGHCASLLTVPAEVQAHTQEPSSGEVYESRRLRHCADYSVTEAFVAQSKANNLFIKSACVGTQMVQDGARFVSLGEIGQSFVPLSPVSPFLIRPRLPMTG